MAWEVFTLVIGCTSGAFLDAALASFSKGAFFPADFNLKTKHLKKGQDLGLKQGPSLHPYAPSLQIGPFAFLRTKAKGSSIVQHSG
jgi:hypothetical protein